MDIRNGPYHRQQYSEIFNFLNKLIIKMNILLLIPRNHIPVTVEVLNTHNYKQ